MEASEHEAGGSVFGSLRHGLTIVGRSPLLLGTMIAAGVTMLGLGAVNVLFVPLMIRDLQVPATWLGAVDGAQTLSMILAAGLVATIATRLRPTMIIVVGLAGIAVFIGLVAGVTERVAGRRPAVPRRLVRDAARGGDRHDRPDGDPGQRARPRRRHGATR